MCENFTAEKKRYENLSMQNLELANTNTFTVIKFQPFLTYLICLLRGAILKPHYRHLFPFLYLLHSHLQLHIIQLNESLSWSRMLLNILLMV